MNSALQSLFSVLRRAGFVAALSLAGLAVSPRPACAQAAYVYSGNTFTTAYAPYTSVDRVVAILQLSSWLAPNLQCVDASALPGFRLIMEDGINQMDSATITAGTGTFHAFVSTNQNGQIEGPWLVEDLSAVQGVAITSANLPSANTCAQSSQTEVFDNTVGVLRNVPCPGCPIFPPIPSQSNTPGVWSFPPPRSLATMLINEIQLGILPDIGTSFLDQLQQIQTDISTSNGQACADVSTLMNEVRAQSGKKLTIAQANFILNTLKNMQVELGCG